MLVARGSGPVDDLADQRVDVDSLWLEADLSGFHPVEVQHLVDHPVQALRIAEDVAGQGLHVLGAVALGRQDLAEPLDAYERGAELVAHHRDELALELAEPLEAGEVGGGRLLRVVLGGDVRLAGGGVRGELQDRLGISAARRQRPRHETRETRSRVDREKLRQIDLHWHDLRHEGACRLLSDGVDIRTIQLMLGHADIKQTQRYLNITDEELRRTLTGVWERRRQLRAVGE